MMIRKFIIVCFLLTVTVILYSLYWYFEMVQFEKVAYASVAVTVLYGLFNILLEESVIRHTSDAKMRYTIRKATSLLFLSLSLVVVLRIFIPNPEALLVAYGLMGAGVAIALQDLFKNFAGSVTLFVSGAFRVGDRIEINGTYGDVIDIGLFYTTLLELREWVQGDQATGRILSVPNGAVLSGVVKNYTKHHPFLWDEIHVIITSESDWRAAMHILGTIAYEKTEPTISVGRESLQHMRQHFYVDTRSLEPVVYLADHEQGTELTIRYVVDAKERRAIHSQMWESISVAFADHPGIALAPHNFASTPYPMVER